MKQLKFSVGAAVLMMIGTGCAQGTSGTVPTEEIDAAFRVVGHSGQVTCRATFQHGSGFGGTYLELTDGDTATCGDGTTTVTLDMDEDPIFGTIDYVTTSLPYD